MPLKLLAVRTVTTENKGKRTAGVDRVKVNTPRQKMALVKDMLDTIQNGWDKYRPMPAKRIYIPKASEVNVFARAQKHLPLKENLDL
ncbi:hypothetical protein PN36_13855 [Candidatus Thiomargarita nelsonii]|uniref:Reverse transcriptase N-terminal domain-containing protein n=1 Tax=Candidatus Thiomargarita nelsonii TaxID=1003181 RepID=A0A4E0QTM9_9GAMM|nr:hypothetical protein PN36_13855 [Candidatus Thiomargarita nelsonii]